MSPKHQKYELNYPMVIIIIKLLKMNIKEKITETAREKRHNTYTYADT